ncbi:Fe2+-dependent dioxygenase [Marinobacterium aestuarii]|uniref:Fe2+-dependent dioxygenase n=1 Tax=Marinobacterium aestuarii TaxID=1821621 RepID=A0A1A9EV91_9GAMM|nr:Fe2+-dependent dioxygenase [Marinobacterium aestuarii]ANG61712.1 Fe2+-dependent dioxygenase [Marinobacterium aestuarii]
MITPIGSLLGSTQLAQMRTLLDRADWVDGRSSAGAQALEVKRNRQLPADSPLAQQLGDLILAALSRHPTFISAALPLRIMPPLFNRYEAGETYGLHVDNALRFIQPTGPGQGAAIPVRTDLSATLFLTDPEDYDGGELEIESSFGAQSIKLAAGDLILYPASSQHRVTPVTRGSRSCAVFWLQSMVRDSSQREMLFDLDQSVQSLGSELGQAHDDVMRLSGLYHNLIRQWAET